MFDVVGWIAAGAVALVMLVMAGGFAFGWENVWERVAGPADRGAYDFAKGKRRRTPNDALACTPAPAPVRRTWRCRHTSRRRPN